MTTNSRIARVYPKHFDPNPEAIWENIEKRVKKAEEEDEPDESNDEFDIYDFSNEDE